MDPEDKYFCVADMLVRKTERNRKLRDRIFDPKYHEFSDFAYPIVVDLIRRGASVGVVVNTVLNTAKRK